MLNSQCEIINKPLSVFLILKGYRGKKHAQCSNYAQSVEAANRTCSIKKVFCVRAYFLIAKNTFFTKDLWWLLLNLLYFSLLRFSNMRLLDLNSNDEKP